MARAIHAALTDAGFGPGSILPMTFLRMITRKMRAYCLRATLAAASLALPGIGLAAAPSGLRVAIYSGTGAESDKTLALYRAVASCGHLPLAVTKSDLVNGRLTRSNFSAFIIPAGEGGEKCCANHFSDISSRRSFL